MPEYTVDDPEEHVTWPDAVPSGRFLVEAFFFKAVDPNKRQTIPFTMTFKLGADEKNCSSEVKWFPKSDRLITRDGKLLGTADPYIDWTPSAGLPKSCDWSIAEGFFCAPGECDKL